MTAKKTLAVFMLAPLMLLGLPRAAVRNTELTIGGRRIHIPTPVTVTGREARLCFIMTIN